MIELPEQHWGESGPQVLLVHGLSSSTDSWWRVAPAVAAEGFRVTAVDLRGHGTAPKAVSYALADYASDLPESGWHAVVGHSLGGAAAVLACQKSGFTKRLVLLDPLLRVEPDEWQQTVDDQLAELGRDEAMLAELRPQWHERDRVAKLAGIRQTDRFAIEHSFIDTGDWDVRAQTAALGVPTLVLRGDPDVYTMLSAETVDALTEANPHIEVRVVAGAGHSPHRDRPEETIAALLEWLGEATSAGAPKS